MHLAEVELLALGQAEPQEIVGVGAGALVLLGVGHPAGLNVAALQREQDQRHRAPACRA